VDVQQINGAGVVPNIRVRDWGGLQIERSAEGMTMISNFPAQVGAGLAEFLEREAGHVIVADDPDLVGGYQLPGPIRSRIV